ncbi:MAG: phosphatase PAP2 family protein [Clostridia bacterium]|nr:phosphatase PAP2 family protein [Clostridia bacterium]
MLESITNFDFSILYFIQENWRTEWLDLICAFLSRAFELGVPWLVLGAVLFCFKKTRTAGAILVCAVVLTFFFNELAIKNAINRERPCTIDPTIELIVKKPTSYSFPSGHTASCFAAAGTLLFTYKRLGIPLIIFSAFMGFSRMYLFVHFPTDVLAGAALGLLMAWVTVLVFRELKYDEKLSNLTFRRNKNERA